VFYVINATLVNLGNLPDPKHLTVVYFWVK